MAGKHNNTNTRIRTSTTFATQKSLYYFRTNRKTILAANNSSTILLCKTHIFHHNILFDSQARRNDNRPIIHITHGRNSAIKNTRRLHKQTLQTNIIFWNDSNGPRRTLAQTIPKRKPNRLCNNVRIRSIASSASNANDDKNTRARIQRPQPPRDQRIPNTRRTHKKTRGVRNGIQLRIHASLTILCSLHAQKPRNELRILRNSHSSHANRTSNNSTLHRQTNRQIRRQANSNHRAHGNSNSTITIPCRDQAKLMAANTNTNLFRNSMGSSRHLKIQPTIRPCGLAQKSNASSRVQLLQQHSPNHRTNHRRLDDRKRQMDYSRHTTGVCSKQHTKSAKHTTIIQNQRAKSKTRIPTRIRIQRSNALPSRQRNSTRNTRYQTSGWRNVLEVVTVEKSSGFKVMCLLRLSGGKMLLQQLGDAPLGSCLSNP